MRFDRSNRTHQHTNTERVADVMTEFITADEATPITKEKTPASAAMSVRFALPEYSV